MNQSKIVPSKLTELNESIKKHETQIFCEAHKVPIMHSF